MEGLEKIIIITASVLICLVYLVYQILTRKTKSEKEITPRVKGQLHNVELKLTRQLTMLSSTDMKLKNNLEKDFQNLKRYPAERLAL